MALLEFFIWLNDGVFAIPATILFLSVGIFLTIKTNVIQFRGIYRLYAFLKEGSSQKETVAKPGGTKNLLLVFLSLYFSHPTLSERQSFIDTNKTCQYCCCPVSFRYPRQHSGQLAV